MSDWPSPPPVPVGGSVEWAGAADPPGGQWMIEDGRSLVRASYPDLFTALGGASSPWGLPDGTHFNIPDSRGRVAVGVDGAAARLTANDALGNSSGEEAHAITIAELAAHNHGGATGTESANHTHAISHDHTLQMSSGVGTGGNPQPPEGVGSVVDIGGGGAGVPVKNFVGSSGIESTAWTHSISSQGSGTAHNNMQPFLIKNKIIRVL